jgi:hypothetical protein
MPLSLLYAYAGRFADARGALVRGQAMSLFHPDLGAARLVTAVACFCATHQLMELNEETVLSR